MPRTIFFFSSATIMGGAERCLQEIVLELHQRGHRCVMATPGTAPLRDWAIETGLAHEPLEIGTLRQRNPLQTLTQITHHRRFARGLTRKYGPGIFYSNTRHAFIMLALLPSRYTKIAHHHEVVSRRVNNLLYPRVDTNIFVSSFHYQESGHPANGRIVPNAGAVQGDVNPVAPPDGTLRMAMFSRISRNKGHEHALGACAILRRADIDYRLDIWGTPHGSAEDRLQERLQDVACRDDLNVTFRGFHPKPQGIMRDYHCILNPTQNESFGRIPVEGFSLGVPVMSYASGGALEVYSGLPDYEAFLVREFSAEMLAQAILLLRHRYREDETLAGMVSRIQNDVKERFNISRVADDVEAVLVELAPPDSPLAL